MQNKIEQRNECLIKRQKIEQKSKNSWNLAIFTNLKQYLVKNKITKVGIYWSKNEEVSTTKIIDYCLKNKVEVFLPKIESKLIYFYKYKLNDKLIYNERFAIYEPKSNNLQNSFEIIIIPMVGYDNKLNRLGYGGGFYDKYLQTRQIFKIGIAYKIQKLKKINVEEHDIKMDLIITE